MSEDETEKPKTRSLFLKASDPETWQKPEDVTWGDHFLVPGRPLNARQKKLAKMAAWGKTNNEICEELGYTPGRVSVLLGAQKVKDEIERIQDKMHEADLEEQLKMLGGDAMNVMEAIINDENLPPIKKEAAAKWVLEKLTGKAAQQIDVKGEISVGHFLDKLNQAVEQGKIKNVTPMQIPSKTGSAQEGEKLLDDAEHLDDPLADWINKNID